MAYLETDEDAIKLAFAIVNNTKPKPLTTKQAEYPALSRCLILSLYLLSAAPVSWSACSSL